MNNVVNPYNNYFNFYKKSYDVSTLNERKSCVLKQFKLVDNMLPEWLESKNDFNEAKKLIDDVKVDMNKANVSKEDKKVFNYLNRLITDISNNRVEKENAVERLKKSLLGLDRLKQKQSTAFQNNMIQVVYQLFNSFGFNKEFEPLFSKKDLQIPLRFKINKPEFKELTRDIYNNQDNKDF